MAKCPQCEHRLRYHVETLPSARTIPFDLGQTCCCHRCGYHRQMPEKCPHCGSNQIRAYGLGSEKVEAEVQALFPAARTLRWDWETTRQKDAHEIILSHFVAHRADVLVGTQMLAKGLDLPLVTLVGIVLADVGLNLPDPFAAERTFDVLTQVAGRAGRSSLGGRVVLQTFQPEHYAFRPPPGTITPPSTPANWTSAAGWAIRLSAGWCGWSTGPSTRSKPRRRHGRWRRGFQRIFKRRNGFRRI